MNKFLQKYNQQIIKKIAKSAVLFFSVLAANNVFGSVEMRVSGIENPQIRENVELYLAMISKEEADGSERYFELVQSNISKAVRVYGYYNAKVEFFPLSDTNKANQKFSLTPQEVMRQLQLLQNKLTQSNKTKTDKATLRLEAKIDLGEPTRIEETDIVIEGEASQDEAFRDLNKTLPKKGTIVSHEAYDDYKANIEKLALRRGYFDSEFSVHQLQVMPSTKQAWWRIDFNSGTRYRYGEVLYEHSQIREDFMKNMLTFQQGDGYLLDDISQMTNDYSSMGWFQSVMVRPELKMDTKTVDLHVMAYPKKKNTMELGLGYSSDVGVRGQIGWSRPWINSRGHSVRTNLNASSKKQTFEATYKMPLLENPMRYYYEFSVGAESEKDTRVDTDATSVTVAALRYWNHPTGWQYSAGLRVRYDDYTQGGMSNSGWLVYPTASVSRSRISGGIFPRRADKINITVDYGTKALLSDTNFFSIRAYAGWIKQFAPNHRFVTHGEIGYLRVDDINKIPPALRFFAGGDRSVRGYGYKKISPKDPSGKLIGASRLLAGTVEYQYQFIDDWWLATFADGGLADKTYDMNELRYGAGVGVRWASPVGAIKLDIATPIRDKDNSKNIQFYIGLGTEL